MQVERKTLNQQVVFGIVVGVIIAVLSRILLYITVGNPQRIPVATQMFVHGYIRAPQDLVSRDDIMFFEVYIVPNRQPSPDLLFGFPPSDERQFAVLIYRDHNGVRKSATWNFVAAYDESGEYVPLKGVGSINLVRSYKKQDTINPLKSVFISPQKKKPIHRFNSASVAALFIKTGRSLFFAC